VELREKQGLAYEVAALYPTRLDPASFVVYLGTAPENGAIALENLQAELHRLCTTPLSSDELQVAKNKILGQYSLGKQTNGQIAQVFGWYETLGLGVDFDQQFQQDIEAATVEKCQEVACRYFQDPFVSLVGPAAALPT
jgi:predicted Zn-dependent peptidase